MSISTNPSALFNNIDINSPFIKHILQIGQAIHDRFLPSLFDLIVGICIIWLIVRAVRLALSLANVQPGLRGVISSIIETVLWIFLFFVLLQELGLGGIIVFFTGSIAALGIAMAAGGSTLVSDVIAGIFLARDADFNVGDEVVAGETPTRGVIESMDARRTRIRDDAGVLHIVPNSVVERKEWVLVRGRPETGALAKAARRIRAVANVKRVIEKKSAPPVRKNDQSQP